ncbi:MAG: hypothetical protein HC933_19870 [Pleurocapsa sp. SU_196_0]|nr:hypothetical protein [Pleurocapsa sp. SU_196_0]
MLEDRMGLAHLQRVCGRPLCGALAMTRQEWARCRVSLDSSSARVLDEVGSDRGYPSWQDQQPSAYRDGVG